MFVGEQATRMVVADGRRVAASCSGPQRSDLLRLCDETEILTNQLSDLIAKGQVLFISFKYYYYYPRQRQRHIVFALSVRLSILVYL